MELSLLIVQTYAIGGSNSTKNPSHMPMSSKFDENRHRKEESNLLEEIVRNFNNLVVGLET